MPRLARYTGKTLVDQMAEDLKRQIDRGEIAPDNYLPTEAELGDLYRVSRVTVRRALQKLVSDQVLVAVPRKGHLPVGRQKNTKSTFRIAYLVESADGLQPWSKFEMILLTAIQEQIFKTGDIGMAIGANKRNADELFAQLIHDGVNGVILDLLPGSKLAATAERLGLPCVVVNSRSDDPDIDVVLQDNFNSSRYGTQYLIDRGHRQIGYIGYTRSEVHAEERYAGFRAAMHSAKISESPDGVFDPDDLPAGASIDEAVERFLQRPGRLGAYMCTWESLTMALCRHRVRQQITGMAFPEFVGWSTERYYQDFIVPACTGFPPPPVMAWRPENLAAWAVERLRLRCSQGPITACQIRVPYRLKIASPT